MLLPNHGASYGIGKSRVLRALLIPRTWFRRSESRSSGDGHKRLPGIQDEIFLTMLDAVKFHDE